MAYTRRNTDDDATWARAWTCDTTADLVTISALVGTSRPHHGDIAYVTADTSYYLWMDDGTWRKLMPTGTVVAHHTTHETGGSDEVVALSGAVITSGTVVDARLSANVPLINAANVFTANQRVERSTPTLILYDTSGVADQRRFNVLVNSGQLIVRISNDIGSALLTGLTLGQTGNLTVLGTLTEYSRSTALGHWTAIGYSGADFSSVGGGSSWTVDGADLFSYAYTLVGKTMIFMVTMQNTVIAGSPTQLSIKIPGGFSCSDYSTASFGYEVAGTYGIGMVFLNPGSDATKIFLRKDWAASAWTNGTIHLGLTIPFKIA